ncbi:trehalose-phosphate phosphatase-like [Sitodiplosis mosellana]|uniref:trehalose-phosphate phosphatase-like n=1 Tax=Sitodiplosis mosellana TaxID=263140 RepID=UPI002443E7DD|nr:trehalose-phosphate phosphatase-like [Sitodiplosis mosellana]
MNPCVKCELFTAVFISLVCLTIQSPLIVGTTQPEYLITRDDIHAVLSKIIKPDDSIALLSDFDGTLGRICPNSVLTAIEPAAKDALEQLVKRSNTFTGIISGRPMADVRKRVGIDNCTYSGKHGMEIVFTNKTEFHYPITPELYANCTKLKSILMAKYVTNAAPAWVEDKNISLVFHYRFVPEHLQEAMIADVSELVRKYGYNPVPAHAAIEIKPPVVWSKGHAALLILNEIYGSGWEKNIRVIFLGDDTSDEDVMKMLKGKATTFRITDNPGLETHATYRMQSVDTAVFVLDWLVNNTN